MSAIDDRPHYESSTDCGKLAPQASTLPLKTVTLHLSQDGLKVQDKSLIGLVAQPRE